MDRSIDGYLNIVINCAKNGNIELLEKKVTDYDLLDDNTVTDLVDISAEYGNLNILMFLVEKFNVIPDICYIVVNKIQTEQDTRKYEDILEWMIKNNYPLDSSITEMYADRGDKENLEKIMEKGVDIDYNVPHIAIEKNRMDIFKLALEYGYEYNDFLLYQLAVNDQLETIQWIHKNELYLPDSYSHCSTCDGEEELYTFFNEARRGAEDNNNKRIIDWLKENKLYGY